MTEVPWKDADICEGTVPQQAILYPRPVVLECQECGWVGYWYPAEDKIDTGYRVCLRDGTRPARSFHVWAVQSWNGNAPQAAPVTGEED
jgi:hypothetical protein